MIRTANGTTSRPISRLYPLELTSEQENHTIEEVTEESGTPGNDPVSERGRPS